MKDYRSYMDAVSVDATLHDRIMRRVAEREERLLPVRRRLVSLRYAGALVCAALMLTAVWAVTRLPTRPSYLGKDRYALLFNWAQFELDSSRNYLPGYFMQELSQEEVKALLGDTWDDISEGRTITAIAGFSGEGTLDGVTVTCTREAPRLISTVQIADGPAPVHYSYDGEPKTTDVDGTSVIAGYYDASSRGERLYYASFTLHETGYHIELSGDESATEELTALVNMIVRGGAADLGQITPDFIPEWREDEFTLAEARSDADFGAHVSALTPSGLVFEGALRILNQRQNELVVGYASGMRYLRWTVLHLTDEAKERVVDIGEPDTYDLSLYPIPRAESVPEHLRRIVNNPVFKAEDLTLDAVLSRAYTVDDAGDVPGYRMRFSVLYGNVVVEVSAKGVQPKDVFNMLNELRNPQ